MRIDDAGERPQEKADAPKPESTDEDIKDSISTCADGQPMRLTRYCIGYARSDLETRDTGQFRGNYPRFLLNTFVGGECTLSVALTVAREPLDSKRQALRALRDGGDRLCARVDL